MRTNDRINDCGSSRDSWRGGERTWRMERQLANGTEFLIGAELGGYDPAMRDDALMKMDRADQLREKYQRCADRRDRAG